MGRMYTATLGSRTVTAAVDLIELNAPADAVLVVHSVTISQSSDAGNAEAELLQIGISRASTSGSGGVSVTARPHNVGDAAFGGTAEVTNTTKAGTRTEVAREAFNVQAGWFYRPTPEERIVISPSGRLCIELINAPADSLTMTGSITFEEIGG